MKYVEPESDEEEDQEPQRRILPTPKSANKKEGAAAGPSGRTRSTRVVSKEEKMEIDQEESNDEDKPLFGKKIVVSGEFESISRKKLEELIEQLGGQKMSGVSSRTHYLIIGYKLEDGRQVTQGSKYANAKKHGTTILTELEFEKLIQEKSGNPEFTLSIRKSLVGGGGGLEKQTTIRRSIVSEEEGGEKNAMWTDVYRPSEMDDLVGNEGVVDQLYEWLRDWDDVVIRGNKKDIVFRRNFNWKDQPNPNAKAVLLSGPPGIGKTSAARIVCRKLGYEALETNASDTRNKAQINHILGELSSNQSLDYFSLAGLKRQKEEEKEH